MDTIARIEQKISNYESQFISENILLKEKINEFYQKERHYQLEIRRLQGKIQELEFEKTNSISGSQTVNLKINSLQEDNNNLINEYQNIRMQNSELKKQLEEEKIKTDILIEKINKLSMNYEQSEKECQKLNDVVSKYSTDINEINNKYKIIIQEKENFSNFKSKMQTDLQDLQNMNTELRDSNLKLSDAYEKMRNEKQSMEEKLNALSGEHVQDKENLAKLISYCNTNIEIITKWLDNFFNEKVSLFDFNVNNDGNMNGSVSFIKIKNALIKAKNDIINKIDKLNEQMEGCKKNFIGVQNNNYKLNKILENIFNHLIQEIDKEKYFVINKFKIDEDCSKDIEDMLNKIFALLKKIKQSSYDKSLDKLIEDNTQLHKSNSIYKTKALDLFNDNKVLVIKNRELMQLNQKLQDELNQELSNKAMNYNGDNEKLIKDNIELIKRLNELEARLNGY